MPFDYNKFDCTRVIISLYSNVLVFAMLTCQFNSVTYYEI